MPKSKKPRTRKKSAAAGMNQKIASLWSRSVGDDPEAMDAEFDFEDAVTSAFLQGKMTDDRISAIMERPHLPEPLEFYRKVRSISGCHYLPLQDGSLLLVEAFVIPISGILDDITQKVSENVQAIAKSLRKSGYSRQLSNVAVLPQPYAITSIAEFSPQSVFFGGRSCYPPYKTNPFADEMGDPDPAPGTVGIRFLLGFRGGKLSDRKETDGFDGPCGLTDEEEDRIAKFSEGDLRYGRMLDMAEERHAAIIRKYEDEVDGLLGDLVTIMPPVLWDEAPAELLLGHIYQQDALFGGPSGAPPAQIRITTEERGMRLQLYSGGRLIGDTEVGMEMAALAGEDFIDQVLNTYDLVRDEPVAASLLNH